MSQLVKLATRAPLLGLVRSVHTSPAALHYCSFNVAKKQRAAAREGKPVLADSLVDFVCFAAIACSLTRSMELSVTSP